MKGLNGKGVIRSCILKMGKKMNKYTNNDLQSTTQKTKEGATQITLKTNNDLQNTTLKTKEGATQITLK